MAISESIAMFRDKNNLSQIQLAQKLNVSQQLLSEWENKESLPEADDLINMSKLFEISIDELISGEKYLRLPFNFGKPRSRIPAISLSIVIILSVIIVPSYMGLSLVSRIAWSTFLGFCIYSLAMFIFPFDFKNYFNYWTLEKKGILYATQYLRSPGVKGVFDEYVLPIKALLHMRKTNFVPYSEIKKIELVFIPFKESPDRAISVFRYYLPRMQQLMREDFFFRLTTKDDSTICLDLRQYFKQYCLEYILLPAIISFLQNKGIPFVDRQNLGDSIKSFERDFVKNRYSQVHS